MRSARPPFPLSSTLDLPGSRGLLSKIVFTVAEVLAMPLRQYFVWVGSVLLVALFVADWCLPAPVAHPHSEIPPNQRVSLRIRSDQKWPERIVFDTAHSALSLAAEAGPEPTVVPPQG